MKMNARESLPSSKKDSVWMDNDKVVLIELPDDVAQLLHVRSRGVSQ